MIQWKDEKGQSGEYRGAAAEMGGQQDKRRRCALRSGHLQGVVRRRRAQEPRLTAFDLWSLQGSVLLRSEFVNSEKFNTP